MSHLANARALARLEQAYDARRGGFAEAVAEADRLHRALTGITKFVRVLAGTYEEPAPNLGNYTGEKPARPHPEPRLEPSSPVPIGRVWTKDIRPDPREVLTWQEVQRIPWVDELAERERR